MLQELLECRARDSDVVAVTPAAAPAAAVKVKVEVDRSRGSTDGRVRGPGAATDVDRPVVVFDLKESV